MSDRERVVIAKPLNEQGIHNFCFNDNIYPSPAVSVSHIHEAFIAFNGVVLKKGLLLEKKSVYGDPRFLPGFRKRALEQMFASCILRSIPLLTIRDTPVILPTQPWMNFYHWLLESLPRIIQAKKHWKEAKILIQPTTYNLPYVKDILDLFPELNFIIPEKDINVWAKDLLLPNLRPDCAQYNRELLLQTRNEVLGRIKQDNKQHPQRLFIFRKGRRPILNFEELQPLIARYNFSIIDFNDYGVIDQINIVRNATHIIGQHGAGLSHILFTPQNCKIVELHKKIKGDPTWSGVYWTLAGTMGNPYYSLFCESPETEEFFAAPITVDPAELEQIFKLIVTEN